MTAKQAALNNLRVRSQDGRYLPSSFTEQHKMINPEVEGGQVNAKVSEFSIKDKPSFHRVKSGDAAHEISQVMQAAAKSQREATSHMNKVNNMSSVVQAPKVIANPKIIGSSKMSGVDIPHLQAFMTSLKHASGSHSNSTNGLKVTH